MDSSVLEVSSVTQVGSAITALDTRSEASEQDRSADTRAGVLVSVVVPSLNEELCIGEFVDWCLEGLRKAGVSGEVLIIDSSTDRSAEIAEQHGARVLRMPKRGLGRAYIDAIPFIRGQYVIMGDCDLTYDFRELGEFVERLRQGYEFVMGSRFKGHIEAGAMPALHRYFGTPITTWTLNVIYGSRFSDIHCGMRAITRDALVRMNIESQSWEYASEMVAKAASMRLQTTEVAVRFYKDREGRLSHHKRAGWLSPWLAGWINLRAMFLYAPDFFLTRPGWALFLPGLLLTLSLVAGPRTFHGIVLNLHWMLLGVTLTVVGYNAILLGMITRVFYDFDAAVSRRLMRMLTYNRGVIGGILVGLVGIGFNSTLVYTWVRNDFRLSELNHSGVFGLLLIVVGFQTFTSTLVFQMIAQRRGRA
jgi:glycosyltransferase involved in cell wall biosynthesis